LIFSFFHCAPPAIICPAPASTVYYRTVDDEPPVITPALRLLLLRAACCHDAMLRHFAPCAAHAALPPRRMPLRALIFRLIAGAPAAAAD